MCNSRSRCFQIDMIPTTTQFFETIFEDRIKILKSDYLNYKLDKMKSRIIDNKTFYFENEITYEIIDTFNRHFNHNDRDWGNCYEVVFWLLQAYKYKVLFNEQDKKLIEEFFDPFEKDLKRYSPQNITDEEIKLAMQGIKIINISETEAADAHNTSTSNFFLCNII